MVSSTPTIDSWFDHEYTVGKKFPHGLNSKYQLKTIMNL